MASENDGKVFQLAMAFGQGAGPLLASEQATVEAASRIATMLEPAFKHWRTSGPIAVGLVRIAGQVAAQRAIERHHLYIEFDDIDWGELEKVCGCIPSAAR